jgi:AraC-like DNA-binding protein
MQPNFQDMKGRIPTHRIAEKLPEGIALRYIPDDTQAPGIDYAHRDDYFIFLFAEKGEATILIDFKEQTLTGAAVFCIMPGQVHLAVDHKNISGWVLIVDSMLVKNVHREVFEKLVICKNAANLDGHTANELNSCALMLHRRLDSGNRHMAQDVVHALIDAYIGMIAEVYQKGFSISMDKRPAIITFQFKSLLSSGYKSMKSPSLYASKLNLSPVYLNEAVKKTTGLSVSNYIRNEIVIHAKRLLFYTELSIKEIAFELGYDDNAYFTRLFTKVSGMSPTQFRANYRK